MKNTLFVSQSPSETANFAFKFTQGLSGGDIITLTGDLGAGKTTFTQSVLAALGSNGPFTSPTFTIIKQYDLSKESYGGLKGITRIYHVDAYRIASVDMVELGWSEMIVDCSAIIIVEWPEKISSLIPEGAITMTFEMISEQERKITISVDNIAI